MARNGFGRFVLWVLIVILVGVFVPGLYFFIRRATAQAPFINLTKGPEVVGKKSELECSLTSRAGLRDVTIEMDQGGTKTLLYEEHYPGPKFYEVWKSGPVKEKTLRLEVNAKDLKLKEGPALLRISARDYALRHLEGNQSTLQKGLTVALLPPRLEALSKQHYINQGGSEFLVYRVGKTAVASGVKVGNHFFPGCANLFKDPDVYGVFFAVPYDVPASTPVQLIAVDSAGNEAQARFFYKTFPKQFPHAKINLSDQFLQEKMPDMLENNPTLHRDADLVKVFMEVNGPLRRDTKKQILELTKNSHPKILWTEHFHQLRNSKVESNFAQQRTYFLGGKEIDRSVHLGYDLAVTAQSPIEAANDGLVVFSGNLAIYGQTVILDHGCGLLTLYGHMSSRRVNVGDKVKRMDILGQTGSTGLAMGDHLHFSVLLNGIEVDCKEWWDPRWIKLHVLDKLDSSG